MACQGINFQEVNVENGHWGSTQGRWVRDERINLWNKEGAILGEEDDDDGMIMCLDQCKGRMLKTSWDTEGSRVFKFNYFCEYIFVGTKYNGVE